MGDAKAWATWWRQNHDEVYPAAAGARGAVAIAAADTPYLLWVADLRPQARLRHRHVGKHDGRSTRRGQTGAVDAIGNLSEDTQFAIVVFNTDVDVWQRKADAGQRGNKKCAIVYVQSQTGLGSHRFVRRLGNGV